MILVSGPGVGGGGGGGLNHVPPLGSPALLRLSYEGGSSNKQASKQTEGSKGSQSISRPSFAHL